MPSASPFFERRIDEFAESNCSMDYCAERSKFCHSICFHPHEDSKRLISSKFLGSTMHWRKVVFSMEEFGAAFSNGRLVFVHRGPPFKGNIADRIWPPGKFGWCSSWYPGIALLCWCIQRNIQLSFFLPAESLKSMSFSCGGGKWCFPQASILPPNCAFPDRVPVEPKPAPRIGDHVEAGGSFNLHTKASILRIMRQNCLHVWHRVLNTWFFDEGWPRRF